MSKKQVIHKETLAEKISKQLIEKLKKGTAPWQLPWHESVKGLHLNATTKKPYTGFNQLILLMSEHKDPRWLTYKQTKDAGMQVKKGEKGTHLQYWITEREVMKYDENGNTVKDKNGTTIKDKERLERPFSKTFVIFNGEQIDGIELYQASELEDRQWDLHKKAENILKRSQAKILHKEQNNAYYNSHSDEIVLPLKEQFKGQEEYYATALHELSHWTGHESRLNRDLNHMFGTEGYAKEELRAEIASMMLGQELGIRHDPSQHVSYVESWIKVLQDDPNEIIKASRDAQKIHNHIMDFDRRLTKEGMRGTNIVSIKNIRKEKEMDLEI